jgi:phage FluMu gp28-like protein
MILNPDFAGDGTETDAPENGDLAQVMERRGLQSPLDLLLPYQRQWVDKKRRFKYGLWSRQSGKSTSVGAEIARDMIRRKKTTWVMVSAGERQALELMEKVKQWTEMFGIGLADFGEQSIEGSVLKAGSIRLPNGSRALALPANASTIRGYSANVVLDEFAFYDDPEDLWRAIYPAITNPLSGEKDLRLITTPNGMGNLAAKIWHGEDGEEDDYWRFKVTIHDAVRMGLPIDIEKLRRGLMDPEGWAQEYECEFMDTNSVLLPYPLIFSCEDPGASMAIDFGGIGISATKPRLYLGLDVGRKRDLTVLWIWEKLGDVLWTRGVLVLEKMSTPDQFDIIAPWVSVAEAISLDYQGIGTGLGDLLAKRFGERDLDKHLWGKVELCAISNKLKVEIFPYMRLMFEQGKVRIPGHRDIREDLHAMHRVALPGGGVTYSAPHSPLGHSDRAFAAALGLRAARNDNAPFTYTPVRRQLSARRQGP